MLRLFCLPFLIRLFLAGCAAAGTLTADNVFRIDRRRGDGQLARYFAFQVAQIEQNCLNKVGTADDWNASLPTYRRQLMDMLGMNPPPERTSLKATILGTVERDGIVVERLHFQSLPGLYVTGNLYRPRALDRPAPTILYVCGHGRVMIDGVSYGNKVHYQHHGVWFARHGYVCLLIDTIQLGEIQGVHHGTYRHGRWWWNSRGYTPAGVEAWNCQRALDYLTSRDDVDPQRIGVTGRSGGGIYSWWLTATDERVAVAVPVAGITSLWNQVVDGCVEGHCDCMFHVNTHRWDFPQIAALAAPRPLLISNSDKDSIFPLEGVIDTHRKTRKVYRALSADANLGLQITEGPHRDTQELRVHAFRWFNRFLKQDETPIAVPAEPLFEPQELKVFAELPDDEINTSVDERFVPLAQVAVPKNDESWMEQRDDWLRQLRAKCFNGWSDQSQPNVRRPIHEDEVAGGRWMVYSIVSEHLVELPLYVWVPHDSLLEKTHAVRIHVIDDEHWPLFVDMAKSTPDDPHHVQAWIAPRGIGPTAWSDDVREHTHVRRRFMLIGQTLDGMRVWDVRRAIQSTREIFGQPTSIELSASDTMAGIALYASLFESNVQRLGLHRLPKSHVASPIFLNVLRVLDVPQAVAMAAEKCEVKLHQVGGQDWEFPIRTARQLGWPDDRLTIEDSQR